MLMRNLLALCLAASAAACASTGAPKLAAAPPNTSTEQYPIKVTHAPDEILLAAHASGLSANQSAALTQLVARWREAGADSLLIKAPTAGGDEAYHAVAAIEARLEQLGVDSSVVQLVGYDAAAGTKAPIVVGFERYHAEIPKCGRNWTSLTHTINNEVDPNFGCANSANIAALVANPEDLDHPATMGASDVARREQVLTKYRSGATTSSAKEDQANGAVSSVAQ